MSVPDKSLLKGINFPFQTYKDERSDRMKEWLVSDKTCKGCKYYGCLAPGHKTQRCCDYTFTTGKIRQNKPAECEVKVLADVKASVELYRRSIERFNPQKKNTRGHADG